MNELESRLRECGIPFWPHAFVTAECDIERLVASWNNEYAVLGYGEHLYDDLAAFCELTGITPVFWSPVPHRLFDSRFQASCR